MEEQVALWIAGFSYPAVFLLLLLCGVGAPLSEELIIITGGLVVARSGASLSVMVLAAYLGVVAGDSALYRIGRSLGPRVFSHPKLSKMLTPARIEFLQKLYARRGAVAVFLARFLPGLRAPAFLLAGATGLPYRRFLLADAAAAWVPALGVTWLGFRFGPQVLADVQGGLRWLLLAAVTVAVGVLGVRWGRRRAAVRATRVVQAPEGET
ncbi:membrane protein DedA with SNARE-associated domain [Archangium gephyra]|uniref:Membrane protein DedA with SNARE-associated domain n=1 Tax=Archangium gephyra TaxID=48 RepID=A0ABX9K9N6_9BACT|nr:DedA family protein [Archangium gephyra]REG36122.1 membrane protein DedA with SNARE-associated domain [Archangium gephyra]